ncbi:hypothetical protein ACXDF8_24960 [Mycolicibacterium sp. CBM1]
MKKLAAALLSAMAMVAVPAAVPVVTAPAAQAASGQPPCYTPQGVPYYAPGSDPCY